MMNRATLISWAESKARVADERAVRAKGPEWDVRDAVRGWWHQLASDAHVLSPESALDAAERRLRLLEPGGRGGVRAELEYMRDC